MAGKMDKGVIRKVGNGYHVEYDSYVMVYDACGLYRGQWQDNMLDDSSDRLFFEAEVINGKPCVNGVEVFSLTPAEMSRANNP